MKDPQAAKCNIAQDIIEQSPAIALRVEGSGGNRRTSYMTMNISQYGYDRRDFICGKLNWADLVHPDDIRPLCETIDRYFLQGIDRYSTQYRIRKADGDYIWINDLSTVVRDDDGNELYSDCIISDYSLTKRSQERIEDNARQQQVLNDILVSLHSAPLDEAFNIALDRTGKYLDISRVLLFEDTPDHTGCRAVYEWNNDGIAPMTGNVPFELDYKKDIPDIEADLRECGMRAIDYGQIPNESAGEFDNEGVISAAIFAVYSGDERYGFICFDECVKERYWDEDTLRFLATIAKLVSTAVMRRHSEDELIVSRRTMETVLDNVPTYIFVTNPDSDDIVFANESFRRDFGPAPGNAALGNSLHGLITRYCKQHQIDDSLIRRKPAYFEVPFGDNDTWLSVQCSLIPWLDGRDMRLFSCTDISEKKQREEYIKKMAYMDHLTGLPNRYRCDIDLERAIRTAKERRSTGYVLFIDMDDFKIVNDGYGHDYGDALLIEFADFLYETCLPGNRVFRFGGDEFVILVDPVNADRVDDIVAGLLEKARSPWQVLSKSFYCTISIGIVRFPDGDMGVKEIIKNADIAMYEAKKIGKNAYAFYTDDMLNNSIERAEMETLMRGAISQGFAGFTTYYQPFVDTHTGEITGAETLVRWFTSSGRLIMPGEFISLAEYLGLIVPLGDFVLREACKQLRRINESGLPDFTVSVNVSIRQLQQQDIIDSIVSALEDTGANPRNLVLEITEGLVATDLQRILIICNELRKQGIQIAMDDFGTGYSSLSHMRDMPIDIIKIDRSFIRNITSDPYANSFIRLISDLGHSMGKQICIEGVETAAQLSYCRETKADIIQGFYFYKPMPSEQLDRELAARKKKKA